MAAKLSTSRILAFDPDPHFRTALRDVLEVTGYNRTFVSCGTGTYRLITKVKPDLLIFNAVLYHCDLNDFHVEFTKSLAAIYMPMIIVLDHPSESVVEWLSQAFYQARVLVKPFDAVTLKK